MDQSMESVPLTVRVALRGGGEDVLLGHGLGGGPELVAYALLGAAAFAHVAVDAACEADWVGAST